MDTGAGRLVVKVPGVVEGVEDMLKMPVKVQGDRVVTFDEVASVRRSFKDPEGFARVGGQPAVTLEVKKRVGANIIETIAQVRGTNPSFVHFEVRQGFDSVDPLPYLN